MSRAPSISVVMPVYNAETFVREAVESILTQTFTDFELIAVNDGSTDGSLMILKEIASRDQRIVLLDRPHQGIVAALNAGIECARGEFIARMDADDVAMPERFALQYRRMIAEPKLGVLGSFARIIDKTGKVMRILVYPVTPKETARYLEYASPVAHPTVMIRKEALTKVKGYRAVVSYAEDYDLWLRISEIGYSIANLPMPLLNYRMHGMNVSVIRRDAQILSATAAIMSHRCRKAGLKDPLESVAKLDCTIFEAVPNDLRFDIDSIMFVLRHSHVSLADETEIKEIWKNYKVLHSVEKKASVMAGFLTRMLRGAVGNRSFQLACSILVELVRLHPREIVTLLWRKFIAGTKLISLKLINRDLRD